jgi:hypothetical protein
MRQGYYERRPHRFNKGTGELDSLIKVMMSYIAIYIIDDCLTAHKFTLQMQYGSKYVHNKCTIIIIISITVLILLFFNFN